jgi:hypothetical protein
MLNFGTIVAGFCFTAIIPTAVAMMWPTIDPATGWTIIATAGVIGTVAGAHGLGLLKFSLPVSQLSPTEAARLIYRKASPALKQVMRETARNSEDGILSWGRQVVHTCGAAAIIRLRGRRAPGLPLEPIPSTEVESLWLRDDDSLGGPQGSPPEFLDLKISRRDAMRVLSDYEAEV